MSEAIAPLRLTPSAETVHWGYFDARIAPCARIRSGERIVIETVSGARDNLPPAPFTVSEAHRNVLAECRQLLPGHICTGPVYVEGAKPGGVLEVTIEAIEMAADWAFTTTVPLTGVLPDLVPEKTLHHSAIDAARGVARLPWGTEVPLAPFFGVMAVAPPTGWGRISTLPPRQNGGNIDNKMLVAGTTLYLPVFQDGALFSAGDGHGAQGDGEVCETALETALKGTFRLTARNDMTLAWPAAETADCVITMAFHADLDRAVEIAVGDMVARLRAAAGLSASEAYALASLTADVRVTQAVNGNRGAHVVLDKRYLAPVGA
ncbi:acetamidase/formamidase family protein [Acuticoccus kandeliae]|uniref:acetamidase/formamidase family protein n=1 Tax=Acuticoccus kandeliae TaxID=2073160 RepID=UPI000D3E597A|nr:acetamidase/formamidase family protein [Acuticoccus kandeliae]